MENLLNGEQPKEEVSFNELSEITQKEHGEEMSLSGSLGKFKDAESLLEAYNNLQAEFTKKCQKLSEVGKELEKLNSAELEKQKEQGKVFESDSWKESVSAFLMQNSDAKEYSGDICNEILNDKDIQTSPHALELAWARVMKKKYASPEMLATDEDFINNKILSREDVKNRILNDYFMSMQNNKTPPIISKSGSVAGVTQKQPTTMSEAKEMVAKLFNLKG